MTEFEIRQEGEGMDSADSPINFEEEISYWLPREDITDQELSYDIITRLLVEVNNEKNV